MEVSVTYLDGVRFEAEARGHKVICDQPAGNRGEDLGMTPPEFLLVSLGTCAAFYAVEYLKTRALPTTGVQVKVHAEKAMQPARLGKFRVDVITPPLEPRHQEGVQRAVERCLIHATLLHPPEIAIAIQASEAAREPSPAQT